MSGAAEASASLVFAGDCPATATKTGALVRTLMDVQGSGGRLVRHRVEVPAGAAYEGTAGPAGQLWFVIDGQGRLDLGGTPGPQVSADDGLRVHGGTGYRLVAAGAGTSLDVVELPGDAGQPAGQAGQPVVAALADRPAEWTGDRRFRVLFGPGEGCELATQFVGEIPPGRAPEHSHTYDEVVLILAGQGVVHLPAGDRPLTAGSCVHLPPGTAHCLENTGQGTLMVLGVFHPGGSPAAKRVSGAS